MVDKKLSEFSQITPAEISKLICLFLDQNNAIKNGVVDFSTLDALLAHKAGTETFTGNKTFSGDTVFSGNATFNQTVNANVSGSSSSCTGNSATATKATQDASGNNITDTYATKTLDNMNPSATAKETIVGWGMPDYSAGVSISTTLDTVYQATKDGLFVATTTAYNSGSLIYVQLLDESDNVIIDRFGNYSSTISGNYAVCSICLPIPKTYKVKIKENANVNLCAFYPMKGV